MAMTIDARLVAGCMALGLAGCAVSDPAARMPVAPPVPASLAQKVAAMPRGTAHAANAPRLSEAVAAAQAGVALCESKGTHVTVLVADADGYPIAMLSGDGASARSTMIAQTKVAIVLQHGVSGDEVVAMAAKDPAIEASAAANPDIGVLRGGGFPVKRGDELYAIVAASGAIGAPGMDNECALEAVSVLQGE